MEDEDSVGKEDMTENNENIYEEIKVGKNDSSSSRLRRMFDRVTRNERRFQVEEKDIHLSISKGRKKQLRDRTKMSGEDWDWDCRDTFKKHETQVRNKLK